LLLLPQRLDLIIAFGKHAVTAELILLYSLPVSHENITKNYQRQKINRTRDKTLPPKALSYMLTGGQRRLTVSYIFEIFR
jgi:hypothetical protein